MKNLSLIYIGNNLLKEEKELNKYGVNTYRITTINDLRNLPKQLKKTKSIIRGNKLSNLEYKDLFSNLKELNFFLLNSPEIYELHNDNELNYSILKDYSPKSLFFKKSSTTSEINKKIENSKPILPLFVRSDIESAFKYVGIEGCLIKEKTNKEIEKCIQNIDNYIKDYSKIIIKEVKEIKKDNKGVNFEYRAIVVDSKVIMYDYNNKLPSPTFLNIDSSIRKVIEEIKKKGFKGAYFMDFALTINNEIIIVESKDIIKGTIHNVESFAKGVN